MHCLTVDLTDFVFLFSELVVESWQIRSYHYSVFL